MGAQTGEMKKWSSRLSIRHEPRSGGREEECRASNRRRRLRPLRGVGHSSAEHSLFLQVTGKIYCYIRMIKKAIGCPRFIKGEGETGLNG